MAEEATAKEIETEPQVQEPLPKPNEQTRAAVAELVKPLNRNQFHLAEQVLTTWYANPSCALEDCLDPHYWRHIASMLKPFNRIVVDHEGGEWTATLMVRDCDHLTAHCEVISHREFESAERIEVDAYYVKWGTPTTKWGFYLKREGNEPDTMIKNSLPTKTAAEQAMREYTRTHGK